MERWKGRVALVTGASVGIGAAIARALVQHGMKVVGCARSVDKIEVGDTVLNIAIMKHAKVDVQRFRSCKPKCVAFFCMRCLIHCFCFVTHCNVHVDIINCHVVNQMHGLKPFFGRTIFS